MRRDLLVPVVLLDEHGGEGLALVLLVRDETGQELGLLLALGGQDGVDGAVVVEVAVKD